MINALETLLYRGLEAIKQSLDTIDRLCCFHANSNQAAPLYSFGSYVYLLKEQPNFACLLGLYDEIIESYEALGVDVHEMSKFVNYKVPEYYIPQLLCGSTSVQKASLSLLHRGK